MKKRSAVLLLVVILFCLLLSGCMPGNEIYTPEEPAGFFSGVWHGWIAPFSLITALFRDGIRIYEVNNTGLWYDFGFYIAIISGFGGISLFRKS